MIAIVDEKDVYFNNNRAIHVYEKLGYERYKEGFENTKEVYFYRKILDSQNEI